MPMALTDHIDRSNDNKNYYEAKLVMCTLGYCIMTRKNSTIEDNFRTLKKPPVVVLLKFPSAAWKLDGLDE